MSVGINSLSVEAATAGYKDASHEGWYGIEYFDFVIDGRPLREVLRVPADTARPDQETTALRDDWWPQTAVDQLNRLLSRMPGDFGNERVSLLFCPVCGDLGCGALTMELTVTAELVSWTRFGWQDTLTVEQQPSFFDEQTFTFLRTEYERVLQSLLPRYEALVAEELATRNRSLLARLFRRRGSDSK